MNSNKLKEVYINDKPIVNSHNDWDKLEEVIVGKPYSVDYENDKLFSYFYHRSMSKSVIHTEVKPSNKTRDESIEDLENFVHLLKQENVIVKRPNITDEVEIIKTPYWKSPLAHPLMSRDLFIVIGDEIIETSSMSHARKYESELYCELFTDYFLKGAKWTAVPKSRLLKKNYDYTKAVSQGLIDHIPEDNFPEIMFDGAQILRLGKDLIFNGSNINHQMGQKWLTNHLQKRYRIHRINLCDCHIDGTLLVLRPGCILAVKGIDISILPKPFCDWDVIWYEPLKNSCADNYSNYSESSGMNVLSLDENRVVVQDIQRDLIRSLEQSGFTPIPCRWRHGATLGGGFHCLTLDIRRQGVLEDYSL